MPICKGLLRQNKNVRVNKSILSELLELSVAEEDKSSIYAIGVDFVGNLGYLFGIKKYQGSNFASVISPLTIPAYTDQFPSFIETLDAVAPYFITPFYHLFYFSSFTFFFYSRTSNTIRTSS